MSEALGTDTAPVANAAPHATIAVAPGAPSGAAGVAGMLGSLALVVALIFALAWLARKLQNLRAARGDLLQVTGGVSVGGKERVVIVRVGHDHFLVGVAHGQVSLLHRFVSAPGALHVADAGADVAHPVVVPFADRLRELLRTRKAA
ncbi:MAG TPA: flagellar biosynthetic protein FliO [Solimonas sp.]|jgi:flagellar protein FliO/FliZ|nr:flagellar biosynthetic protein FliO [Solimonas sp.]